MKTSRREFLTGAVGAAAHFVYIDVWDDYLERA